MRPVHDRHLAAGGVRQARPQRELLEDGPRDGPAAALPGLGDLPVHPGDGLADQRLQGPRARRHQPAAVRRRHRGPAAARGGRGLGRGAQRPVVGAPELPVRGQPPGAQPGVDERAPAVPPGGGLRPRQGEDRRRDPGGARWSRCPHTSTPTTRACRRGAWDRYEHDPAQVVHPGGPAVRRAGLRRRRAAAHRVHHDLEQRRAGAAVGAVRAVMFDEGCISYEAQLEDSTLFFGETQDFGRWDLGEWAWLGTPGFAGLVSWHDVFDPGPAAARRSELLPLGHRGSDRAGPPRGTTRARRRSSTKQHGELRRVADADERDRRRGPAGRTTSPRPRRSWPTRWSFIPLYQRLDPGAAWADTLGGYKHNPTSAGDTWNIELWYRKDL